MNNNDDIFVQLGNDWIIQFKVILKFKKYDHKNKIESYKVPEKVNVKRNLYFACFDLIRRNITEH